jgi:serine/threonine-protein kinase
VPDVLATVLTAEPGWSRLPADLHPRIRLLLERCLEKDPRDRYHDIADARVDLRTVIAGAAGVSMQPPLKVSASGRGPRLVWAAVGVALAALAAWVGTQYLRPADPSPVTRLAYPLPEGQSFTNDVRSMVAIAPDGSSMVYVANNQIHRRAIDALEATAIRGTSGDPSTPFFAPDGQSLAYWDAGDAQLKRIPLSGGTAVTLAPAVAFYGGSWGADGNILYGQEDGIWRIAASGGSPQHVVKIEPGERVHGPELLPDGRTLLFTLLTMAQRTGSAAWDDAQIVVQSLESGTRKAIITGADGRFVPTGHVVYALNTVLFAVPFRVSSHEVQGGPVAVIEGVRRATRTPGSSASANYAFSNSGTLVYVPTVPDARGVLRTLVAVDRAGRSVPLLDEQRAYWRPLVSPGGKQLAVEVTELKGDDLLHEQIWIVDLEKRSATPLAVEDDLNVFAVWTPDGQSIVFRSNRDGTHAIYRQRVDGSEGATVLLRRPNEPIPTSATRDGVVAFSDGSQTGLRAIWTVRLGDGSASELLATPAMEHMAMFSPDGKWMAYVSNESGRFEVSVWSIARTDGSGGACRSRAARPRSGRATDPSRSFGVPLGISWPSPPHSLPP